MRKRGAHFQRRLDPHAALRAIGMQQPLDASQQGDLGVALRISFEALRTGRATEQEFHTMAACINVSLVLCERAVGAEHMPIVHSAQAALLRLWQRGKTSGRWGLDGPGLNAIKHGVELHEAQLASIIRREAAEAMREVRRRIECGNIFQEQTA